MSGGVGCLHVNLGHRKKERKKEKEKEKEKERERESFSPSACQIQEDPLESRAVELVLCGQHGFVQLLCLETA